MNSQSILKIESELGTTLISRKASQEISPTIKHEILKNLNSSIITVPKKHQKLKIIIESPDSPALPSLILGQKFKIHSIIDYFEYGKKSPSVPYVADSLRTYDNCIKFKPLLNAILINFKCKKANGEIRWILEFEES